MIHCHSLFSQTLENLGNAARLVDFVNPGLWTALILFLGLIILLLGILPLAAFFLLLILIPLILNPHLIPELSHLLVVHQKLECLLSLFSQFRNIFGQVTCLRVTRLQIILKLGSPASDSTGKLFQLLQ